MGAVQFFPLPENINEWQLLAALDPTTKGGATNDYAAWVEVLFHYASKKMIVTFCDAQQRGYNETINDVSHRILNSTKRYDGIFCEDNAAGTIIADDIAQRVSSAFYSIMRIHQTVPKVERIDALSPYIQSGQLSFVDTTAPILLEQIDSFPYGKNDDAIDALAIIVMQLRASGQLDVVASNWSMYEP